MKWYQRLWDRFIGYDPYPPVRLLEWLNGPHISYVDVLGGPKATVGSLAEWEMKTDHLCKYTHILECYTEE